MQILNAGSIRTDAAVLAIGVPEFDRDATENTASLPDDLDRVLREQLTLAIDDDEFTGKRGAKLTMRSMGLAGSRWVILVGAGDGSPTDTRIAAGQAASFARGVGASSLALALFGAGAGPAHARAAIEGVLEGNYRFDRNREEKSRKAPLGSLTLIGDVPLSDVAVAHAAGQALARDLVNGPAADVYPETLAEVARGLASDQMSVEVWDADRVRAEGMGGIAAVGQASDRPPCFVHMIWRPKGDAPAGGFKRVALVGKGVTFDAGGLSLKPSGGMLTMRCDMGGAGAVLGAMSALDAVQPSVEVHGIFGAAENMVNGNSYKLGDVLTMRNGKTVEIHNTDAEGRLLLADSLAYASELGVDTVLDLATLTGAAVVALGERYTALYTDDDGLSAGLLAAADAAGEGLWRMPLEKLYKSKLKTDWATLKNVGGREGGSITAALFLSEFVDGPAWAHLDIAGPAFLGTAQHHLGKGATGHPVRTLLRWLESF